MNVFEFLELTKVRLLDISSVIDFPTFSPLQQPVPAPVFCVPNTSVDAVIELMNEKQGENGVWVINENKVSLIFVDIDGFLF